MKVLLIKSVANIGRVGEIKEVADGFGRNYLIPNKLALLATPSSLKTAEAQLQKERQEEEHFATELSQIAKQLEGFPITFKAKVRSEESLYGSIRDSDIAAELTQLTGLDIDKGKIELEEPIHKLGEYEVAIRLSKDLAPKIKVTVTKEE
jgi:large subunit ribosomal protein L9